MRREFRVLKLVSASCLQAVLLTLLQRLAAVATCHLQALPLVPKALATAMPTLADNPRAAANNSMSNIYVTCISIDALRGLDKTWGNVETIFVEFLFPLHVTMQHIHMLLPQPL